MDENTSEFLMKCIAVGIKVTGQARPDNVDIDHAAMAIGYDFSNYAENVLKMIHKGGFIIFRPEEVFSE